MSGETATEKIMREQDETRQLSQLAAYQQEFMRRWRPSDLHRRAEFEHDLFYLINLIYREASIPFTKRLMDYAMLHPLPPSLWPTR